MSSKAKAAAMKGDGKPALVPKLRFPEFRDAGGWEAAPLGELLMDSPDYGVNAAAVPFSERLPKYLRITDISDDGTYLSDKKVSVDLEPTDGNYLDDGDIVLARTGASVGKSYRYRKEDGRLVFAGFLIRVKPDKTKLVSAYLANFLTTAQYWDWVAVISARSGQPGIKSPEYSSLAIPLPPDDLAEQQKIADCLNSVDELIATQTRKVYALKAHKKGLMQQLFPRDGENQPRLRFPEFQDAGAWDAKAIGAVCKSFSGGTPSTSQKEYYGGSIPFIRSAEIDRDRTELFLTKEGLSNSAAKLVTKGDVLVALYGANSGDVALARIDGAINQAILCLKSERSNAFIYQYLSFKKEWVVATYLQGGQGNLSGEIVKSISLCFPGPDEQQRIADCLTSLDDLIAAQTQKLGALKTHKNGLMQQLFPSPEEVEA